MNLFFDTSKNQKQGLTKQNLIPYVEIGAVDLLEYIKGKDDTLLAIVIRQGFSGERVSFITPPENFLQLGILNHKEGSKLKPHQHKEKPGTINYTQEVLHLEYGKVEAEFYQNNQVIKKCLLFSGDTIILLAGGHGFCHCLHRGKTFLKCFNY